MAEARAAAPPKEGHVVPLSLYGLVYVCLLALTAATVWAAFADLGPMNNLVALGIAVLKATLVALYFMHVRWSGRLAPLAIFVGLFWLTLLFAGTLADYFTRGLLGVPGR